MLVREILPELAPPTDDGTLFARVQVFIMASMRDC